MDAEMHEVYGERLRVRVCGLCWRDDKLLLVNHRGLTTGAFWAPPGGGLEFGESVDERLRQEFIEETGLQVSMKKFAFACEFRGPALHAIELYFHVSITGGRLQRGSDPEINIIEDVKFMTEGEISALPSHLRHGIFSQITTPGDLKTLTGFFTI